LEFVKKIHSGKALSLTTRAGQFLPALSKTDAPRISSGSSRLPAPQFQLPSKYGLFFVPGVLLAAMRASYHARFNLRGGEDLFFNHHPGYVEFFRCRASHQNSLDHGVNISHPPMKCSRYLFRNGVLKKRPTTSDKCQ
jgi:hypothetical protein